MSVSIGALWQHAFGESTCYYSNWSPTKMKDNNMDFPNILGYITFDFSGQLGSSGWLALFLEY